jgi:hypothetical protein
MSVQRPEETQSAAGVIATGGLRALQAARVEGATEVLAFDAGAVGGHVPALGWLARQGADVFLLEVGPVD